jgi:hypothetical protein
MFRLSGIDQVLLADLSVNDMNWFRVKPGKHAARGVAARALAGVRGGVSAVRPNDLGPGTECRRAARPGVTRLRVHWTDRIGNLLLVAAGVSLAIFLLAPMVAILAKSVQDKAATSWGSPISRRISTRRRLRNRSGTASGSRRS